MQDKKTEDACVLFLLKEAMRMQYGIITGIIMELCKMCFSFLMCE